jgi:hypothetical protein
MKKIFPIRATITVLTFIMILKAQTPPSLANFPDAPADAWFTPYVEEVVESGLMEGNPDGTFGSWEPINRAEFAKVIIDLKSQVQESWLEKHLFEILLVLITLGGWATMAFYMSKISKRPLIIEQKKPPEPKPDIQKNSQLIAEATDNSPEGNRLENDFSADEDEKKKKTNWWL